jgi:5-hydroxyisourate hydrolase / 2-oxo-4-hydroxy-4-carboxy-5-ureidoimidazoline decarboxylase
MNDIFSELTEEVLWDALLRCCKSKNWVRLVMSQSPFDSSESLQDIAVECWKKMTEDDILEAFRGHPMIGANIEELRKKFQTTSGWSEKEQSGMKSASDDTIIDLQKANQDYLEKFGYIFIVCATGKSADEMLALLRERLHNNRDDELKIAAQEQQKITAIRLEKLIMSQTKKSPITTHILDTHRGCPASGVSLELRFFDGTKYIVLAKGVTNEDGRVADLLAGKTLQSGRYQMQFDTQGYHESLGIAGFYPEVVVTFEVQNTEQHYHIPLLLSPFGYSTYRGS